MAKRILLVENEKNLARFVSLELQKESFLVDLAETGQEGLKMWTMTCSCSTTIFKI